ncbi:redoxin domain-containing protein [Planctomicrobium sp. SH664]|uniref:redoxin domain-containing protein n=1 Tax=Planctomicrobium sp. SH664 TaxID=3448125 RepID=UPI003F5BD41B
MLPRLLNVCGCAAFVFASAATGIAAEPKGGVTAEAVLGYQPVQPGVDIETPAPAEMAQCKLESEGSAWVVYGPAGQILRRFIDTNNDRKVDEYRYFKNGLEIYRDIDTDGDNEVDQFRWMNMGGSRWGVDENKDRRIDSWKILSAEEATREAILAMANRDEKRFLAVMITPEEIKSLGITGEPATRLNNNIRDASTKFRQVVSTTKTITPTTTWSRFDCSMLMPCLIPKETGKTGSDLLVYENVMATVDNGGQSGFVHIGEMVRIGNVWKLTQVPQPAEGDKLELADAGALFQPTIAAAGTPSSAFSPRLQELIAQMTELDAKAPPMTAKPEEISAYNVARAKLLEQLAKESGTEEERQEWQRQRLALIGAAAQMGTYPNALAELKAAEQALRQNREDQELLAYAVFQRLVAEYNIELQASSQAGAAERAKVQENWVKSLEGFVQEFAQSPDAADALLQLAITNEFVGHVKEATGWYQKLVEGYPKASAATRAAGSLKRLELAGKPFAFEGANLAGGKINTAAYRGKVLAVIFWATWCKPCTEDLPQIQQLYQTYQKEGFEIVGVNLDSPGAPIQQYLQNYRVVWPQIHEQGGLESRPAIEFGVISLPTMFLVDKSGRVVNSSASVDDLKKALPELLKK